jgi:predicted RND superfamily exporter protein
MLRRVVAPVQSVLREVRELLVYGLLGQNRARRFAALVMRRRFWILLLLLLSSLFFLYAERGLIIQYVDIFPSNHPNVQLQKTMVKIFGGASAVLVAMEVKRGEIFDPPNLDKLNRIQAKIKDMREVVPFRLYSIVSPKFARAEAGFDEFGVARIEAEGFEELYAKIAKGDKAAHERLRTAIVGDPDLFGSLVSRDLKGTVLIANFWHDENYRSVHTTLNEIVQGEEDANTRFYLAGRIIFLGELEKQFLAISLLFGLAVLAMVSLLYIDFRLLRAVFLALSAGVMAGVWSLGAATLLGYKMDVLAMTVPFIILALSHGHSVQMLARYFLEVERSRDRVKAGEEAIVGLLRPALASVTTDAAGFLLLALLPFPILQSMAVVASTGIAAIFITTFIYIPIVLSYLPLPPRGIEKQRLRDPVANFFARIAVGIVEGNTTRWIFATAGVVFVVGLAGTLQLRVGELGTGSPYFWQEADYNVAERVLNEKFTGTNDMWIHVHAEEYEAVLDPRFMMDVYQLQSHLLERDDVRYARSYVNFLRKANIVWHEMNPRWELVPVSPAGGQDTFRMLGARAGGSADDIKDLVEQSMRDVTLTVFLTNRQPETVSSVLADTRAFAEKYKTHPSIQFDIAAGTVGLYEAINELIGGEQIVNLWQLYAMVFLFTSLSFSSLMAFLIVLPPITLGLLITYGLMGYLEVGMFIYTLPIAALGLGVGIDYSLYVMSYLKEGLESGGNREEQKQKFIESMRFVCRAVFFTGVTVATAVIVLFFSPLRLQAMLGVLLALVMMANMIGGTLLVPAIVWTLKPRLIFGRLSQEAVSEGKITNGFA